MHRSSRSARSPPCLPLVVVASSSCSSLIFVCKASVSAVGGSGLSASTMRVGVHVAQPTFLITGAPACLLCVFFSVILCAYDCVVITDCAVIACWYRVCLLLYCCYYCCCGCLLHCSYLCSRFPMFLLTLCVFPFGDSFRYSSLKYRFRLYFCYRIFIFPSIAENSFSVPILIFRDFPVSWKLLKTLHPH